MLFSHQVPESDFSGQYEEFIFLECKVGKDESVTTQQRFRLSRNGIPLANEKHCVTAKNNTTFLGPSELGRFPPVGLSPSANFEANIAFPMYTRLLIYKATFLCTAGCHHTRSLYDCSTGHV